ncbi:tRNA lysidine(34) synthetase TilS [Daejeonella oryzae]|uniref:tRNA lysidine(34) synthetase TilS n=1 Tax=Daejeonella oryzae TaxID=1122943 RepID=UPI0004136734|nr:tRNA lysidine(34) synthetase TilS [Daejeonella oryzae]
MTELERFLSFIKQHALFGESERILLAVSGGRDSVLMSHLFKQAGYHFGIAHCNFNLRGEESIADEEFSSDLAFKLDVPFYGTSFKTEEYARENHISIQMAARDLRYQWLEEIRNDFDYRYIAVAQHQNDVVETVLLNLTRGTGIAGMHGILPKRGKIIRPMLFLTRDEINDSVEKGNLSYREDSSNSSTKYARNKIRLEVIPKLKELNPHLEETFLNNTKRFADLEILLNNTLQNLRTKIFQNLDSDEYRINLDDLKNLNPLNTLLFGLFQPFGFSEAVLNDLVKSWEGNSGKMFYSSTHRLILDRKSVLLSPRLTEKITNYTLNEAGEFSWNNSFYNSFVTDAGNHQLIKEKHVLQADYSLLIFPLIFRTWQAGDFFYPLGMKNKKKLSDFFIEQKIPLTKKQEVGILVNGNGDIIWICGYRPDDRYKIRKATEKVFILVKQNIHGK